MGARIKTDADERSTDRAATTREAKPATRGRATAPLPAHVRLTVLRPPRVALQSRSEKRVDFGQKPVAAVLSAIEVDEVRGVGQRHHRDRGRLREMALQARHVLGAAPEIASTSHDQHSRGDRACVPLGKRRQLNPESASASTTKVRSTLGFRHRTMLQHRGCRDQETPVRGDGRVRGWHLRIPNAGSCRLRSLFDQIGVEERCGSSPIWQANFHRLVASGLQSI